VILDTSNFIGTSKPLTFVSNKNNYAISKNFKQKADNDDYEHHTSNPKRLTPIKPNSE
jgi:hypothetical protein